MGSLSRKIARNAEKKAKKELKSKLNMFDRLGDECLVCRKPFDKKNKDHVTSWFVTVRSELKQVNLYCPDCWESAQRALVDIQEKAASIQNDDKEEKHAKSNG